MATMNGMVDWKLENIQTGDLASYEALDIACARMLAAEDHGGDEDDWQPRGCERIRHSEDGTVSMVWDANDPLRAPDQDDMDSLPVGADMSDDEIERLES